MIFLSSDNGPEMETWPDAAYTPFRCAKGSTWEGGVRVPAILTWPGMIDADHSSDGLFNFSDLFPTTLTLAGAEAAIPGDRFIDGIDQSGFLLAPEGRSHRKYHYYWLQTMFSAVRCGEYKMVLSATSDDPTGTRVLGTPDNCAMGYTRWGTYLTCEENFNGYFRKNGSQTTMEKRYGITAAGFGYLWHTTDKRFRVDEEPNEPNRFGWVVEIDPFKPHSTPVKRTALGRMKHEGAWVQEARNGRVVVYMGDDERNEYIYRYVSNLPWRQARHQGINPLDDGILYVAKFHADGTGEWLPLVPDNPRLAGWSLNDILINTRGAADAAGATMMDRPEWIDTFPKNLTAIATLTNNNRRGSTPPSVNNPDGSTAAGSARPPVDAANPRAVNNYGHIIRWYYRQDWTELTFGWDIFALCGDPANPTHGSTIVGDTYGSPDGIYVDPSGLLWIQTDVSTSTINAGAYAGFGNNQMLAAHPETRETRRFLVGPPQCEVTGVFMTPDRRTMFVGIQHPGERPDDLPGDPLNPKQFSSWPDGPNGGRPRSALIVVTKDDGGRIGS